MVLKHTETCHVWLQVCDEFCSAHALWAARYSSCFILVQCTAIHCIVVFKDYIHFSVCFDHHMYIVKSTSSSEHTRVVCETNFSSK